ncbi:MAG TPA: hypothetical protein VLE51_01105 [Candidatus Saccharimonadales bacterium]|nr:hypothetical protein [Candidatus Saccharimonadales bacterium]
MAELQSQNEKDLHRSSVQFIPSRAAVLLYLLIGLILIIFYNSGGIIQRLSGDYIGSPQNLKANFTTLFDSFSNSFSSALGGRLSQILIWSFIGAIAYIGIWLLRNILNSFENDIISDGYKHPSSYSRAGYWESSLSVKIFLLAMVCISIAYTLIAVRSVLPALSALAGSAAYNFTWSHSPLYISLAIICSGAVVYLWMVLLRLDKRLWQLF